MQYRQEDSDSGIAYYLEGRLEFSDHDLFREIIETTRTAKPKRCVFDLSGLEAIDSAGLGMLVIASEESKKGGWQLELRNARDQVKRMLDLTEITKVVPVAN